MGYCALGEAGMQACDTAGETVHPTNFEWALWQLRQGHRVYRDGWNGKGMWLALQQPDENSKMTRPYIYLRTVDGGFVPWVASQSDLLTEDWQAIYEPKESA